MGKSVHQGALPKVCDARPTSKELVALGLSGAPKLRRHARTVDRCRPVQMPATSVAPAPETRASRLSRPLAVSLPLVVKIVMYLYALMCSTRQTGTRRRIQTPAGLLCIAEAGRSWRGGSQIVPTNVLSSLSIADEHSYGPTIPQGPGRSDQNIPREGTYWHTSNR